MWEVQGGMGGRKDQCLAPKKLLAPSFVSTTSGWVGILSEKLAATPAIEPSIGVVPSVVPAPPSGFCEGARTSTVPSKRK